MLYEVITRAVVPIDVFPRGVAPGQARERERVHEELRDAVAAPHETDELPFRSLERGVRHHVEKPDVKLSDILVQRPVEREKFVPLRSQVRA